MALWNSCPGYGGDEGSRVRMVGVSDDIVTCSTFNNLPEVHYSCTVAYVPNDAQVMRNKQVSEIVFVPKIQQEVDNLCLDRHIQRAHGLIAYD